jgi:hypothetical protein
MLSRSDVYFGTKLCVNYFLIIFVLVLYCNSWGFEVFFMKDYNSRLTSSFLLVYFVCCFSNSSYGISKANLSPRDIHSDILRLLALSDISVCDIPVDEVNQELKRRETFVAEADLKPADVSTIPLDVLVLIANSATSVAGIKPKEASEEISRRKEDARTDDTVSTDGAGQSSLEVIGSSDGEQKAIDKWADNENNEDLEELVRSSEEDGHIEVVKAYEENGDPVEKQLKQFVDNAP